jgi:hypothetical protein
MFVDESLVRATMVEQDHQRDLLHLEMDARRATAADRTRRRFGLVFRPRWRRVQNASVTAEPIETYGIAVEPM